MKLRRVRTPDGLQTEYDDDGQWRRLSGPGPFGPSPFTDEWQLATADRHLRGTDALLPFQPLSFRDFLLSEAHNITAARGMVQRFHPVTHRVSETFEKLTRRTFPPFRPRRLFYRQPIYYMGNAMTIVPTRTPIAFPSYSNGLDFELEVAFVLKEPLLNATADEATTAIGAFVLLNDFSARDVQRAEMSSGMGPQKSKHFGSSMSETAVTADEVLPRINELTGSVIINGRTVSTVSSRGFQWSVGDVLAHASRDEQLLPGELIATGTLAGGSGIETGHWLKRGDTLRLVLDGIGEVEHHILDDSQRSGLR
ncbi:fumarylacetoacetate hydrolase family protein [Mycobacterium sp.]|uniref:fumarylacetoacetate hydrolase family protein n=1 Tax=Mycobacterium sp. TaxID=1785 RepID=UPI002CE11CED|nr:fumarylacetoacetate hydrolase family protein [Mycobacterium sp.]HME49490.1 fumarylacetoacetate hydrolase family protein [Mycobacterium sp.]